MSQSPSNDSGQNDEEDDPNLSKKIHLKGMIDFVVDIFFVPKSSILMITGQMLHMEECKMIVFLGTPQMNDLDAMIRVGLYINDLSMHDFSRYISFYSSIISLISKMIELEMMKGFDDGWNSAVSRAQTSSRSGTAEIQEIGRIHEETRRRDEENRRAPLPDDPEIGGGSSPERGEPY